VLLTSVLGASLAVAESVLVGATTERDATDRYAAATLADRLVTDVPASYPPNVIRARNLTAASVASLAPIGANGSVSVKLAGRTLFERGDPSNGAIVYRAVLVGTPRERRASIDLATADELALPHRTASVDIVVDPGPNTTVHTVRVNGRVVLYNETGVSGEATVTTARSRVTELSFGMRHANVSVGNESAPSVQTGTNGSVDVSYTTVAVEPARLVVRVDV
jgi:hypothetical protein